MEVIRFRRSGPESSDLIVFSQSRWDCFSHRSQHLMTRFARHRRVFYVEEPLVGTTDLPRVHVKETREGVQVIVPHLSCHQTPAERNRLVASLVSEVIEEEDLTDYTIWYDHPKFLEVTRDLHPLTVIYDCHEEKPSQFGGVPELSELEIEMFEKADLVFVGSNALYDWRGRLHDNVHPFPSAVDFEHFAPARFLTEEPSDQRRLNGPRIGLFGNIDRTLDLELLKEMATRKPEWQFVFLGPMQGLGTIDLPHLPNVHYLGKKDYEDLPFYLSGWDLAIAPYKIDENSRSLCPDFIGPCLVAGLPVLSTPLPEVLRHYGPDQLVAFADGCEDFLDIADRMMRGHFRTRLWWDRVDEVLSHKTWERTWAEMATLESEVCLRKRLALCARVRVTETPERNLELV